MKVYDNKIVLSYSELSEVQKVYFHGEILLFFMNGAYIELNGFLIGKINTNSELVILIPERGDTIYLTALREHIIKVLDHGTINNQNQFIDCLEVLYG